MLGLVVSRPTLQRLWENLIGPSHFSLSHRDRIRELWNPNNPLVQNLMRAMNRFEAIHGKRVWAAGQDNLNLLVPNTPVYGYLVYVLTTNSCRVLCFLVGNHVDLISHS